MVSCAFSWTLEHPTLPHNEGQCLHPNYHARGERANTVGDQLLFSCLCYKSTSLAIERRHNCEAKGNLPLQLGTQYGAVGQAGGGWGSSPRWGPCSTPFCYVGI